MIVEILQFIGYALGGTTLIALIAFVVGRSAAHLLLLRFDSFPEEAACSLTAGLGILALVVFLLGIAGVLTPTVLFPVIAVLFTGSSFLQDRSNSLWDRLRKVPRVHWYVLLAVVVLLFPIVLLPLYPPTMHDSVTYHLAVAKQYAQNGAVQPTLEYRYAVFPQLVEMLFALALMLGSDILAQCINLIFLVAIALAIAGFVRRMGYRTSSLWGAALFLSNSAVLVLANVALVDMGLTAFVTLAVLSFENWHESNDEGWLVFSGLMSGFAGGTKYSALFFPLMLGIMAIIASRHQRSVRPFFILTLSCVVTALPWYLYNAYHTGNPAWPFFSGLFGHAYWSDADIQRQTQDLLSATGPGRSIETLIMLPWNLFTHADYFRPEGVLSTSLVVGAPFAIIAAVQNAYARRIAIIVIAFMVFWFSTAQVLRYLIPVVPLFCALAAIGMGYFFQWFFPSRPWVRTITGIIIAGLLLIPGWRFAVRNGAIAGAPPVTNAGREQYLEKNLPPYSAISFLRKTARSAYTLYSYKDARLAYYAEGKFRGDEFGPWRYSRLTNLLDGPEKDLLRELQEMNISHLLVRDDGGGSGCKPEWLLRQHVVPVYRIPGYVLFAVDTGLCEPRYGPEVVTSGPDQALAEGLSFIASGGVLYYVACVGKTQSSFATAVLAVSWIGMDGTRIGSAEMSGQFLPESDTLRILSTSPPAAASAVISCTPIDGPPIEIESVSFGRLRFTHVGQ